MVSRPQAPDLAVDELKRRARRRLIGAIVLALGAAVLLPLLLENEPKPLGDEVSIQIPPVDSGKFVNPLSPGKGAVKAVPRRVRRVLARARKARLLPHRYPACPLHHRTRKSAAKHNRLRRPTRCLGLPPRRRQQRRPQLRQVAPS